MEEQQKVEAPPQVDLSFLRQVASAKTSYSEGWREVAARLLWAEERLLQPARTGCDDCLDARRALQSTLTQQEAEIERLKALEQQAFANCTGCDRDIYVDAALKSQAAMQRAMDTLSALEAAVTQREAEWRAPTGGVDAH